MINAISSHAAGAAFITPGGLKPARTPDTTQLPGQIQQPGRTTGTQKSEPFSNLLGQMIEQVDMNAKNAQNISQKVMLGQNDQLHSSVIALQEASLSLTLMVEVRNKLVESYQEMMRMPV